MDFILKIWLLWSDSSPAFVNRSRGQDQESGIRVFLVQGKGETFLLVTVQGGEALSLHMKI